MDVDKIFKYGYMAWGLLQDERVQSMLKFAQNLKTTKKKRPRRAPAQRNQMTPRIGKTSPATRRPLPQRKQMRPPR